MTGPVLNYNPARRKALQARINLIKGDLVDQKVDAIVSSLPLNMEMNSVLNKALIERAGEQLDEFILEHVYKPRLGDCFMVPGFGLPAKRVIFTVTPNWNDELKLEDKHLLRCYRHPLMLASRSGKVETIAFAALGTGTGKYPVPRAARLAVQGICERLSEDIKEVRIVCFRDETYSAFQRRLG